MIEIFSTVHKRTAEESQVKQSPLILIETENKSLHPESSHNRSECRRKTNGEISLHNPNSSRTSPGDMRMMTLISGSVCLTSTKVAVGRPRAKCEMTNQKARIRGTLPVDF
ncbi:hypothetical protein AVEN_198199-1 [Araneus ventricosus]|uniref:Uncharacterized protein n=1 Tax=Araneus ventricosus TaxID=182803 RepID=A0A4Y2E6J9_ARAVE|nr:hypothetical protein AVEN_198199-1 [Araneus ventricosus]